MPSHICLLAFPFPHPTQFFSVAPAGRNRHTPCSNRSHVNMASTFFLLALVPVFIAFATAEERHAPLCCDLSKKCLRSEKGPIKLVQLKDDTHEERARCALHYPTFCVARSRVSWYCMSLPAFRRYYRRLRRTCQYEITDGYALCPNATPSPTSTPSSSPTSIPSSSTTPTPTSTTTATPTPTSTETASATPTMSKTSTTTATPKPTPSPVITPSPAPYCCNLSAQCVYSAVDEGKWDLWTSDSLSDRLLCSATHEHHCMMLLGVQWYCMSLYDFKSYNPTYIEHCPEGQLHPVEGKEDCPLETLLPLPSPSSSPPLPTPTSKPLPPAPYCHKLSSLCIDASSDKFSHNYEWPSDSIDDRVQCLEQHPDHCMAYIYDKWFCMAMSSYKDRLKIEYSYFVPPRKFPLDSYGEFDDCPHEVPAPYCCNLSEACVESSINFGGWWKKWQSDSLEDRVKCLSENPDHCMIQTAEGWTCMSMSDFKDWHTQYYDGYCPEGKFPAEKIEKYETCPHTIRIEAPLCGELSEECVDSAVDDGWLNWVKWPSGSSEDRVSCLEQNPEHCMIEINSEWHCMSLWDFKVWHKQWYDWHLPGGKFPSDTISEYAKCPSSYVRPGP